MKILDKEITIDELKSIAEIGFGEMVKAVVDVNLRPKDLLAHSDLSPRALTRHFHIIYPNTTH